MKRRQLVYWVTQFAPYKVGALREEGQNSWRFPSVQLDIADAILSNGQKAFFARILRRAWLEIYHYHFSFARVGVPALFARGNCDSREHGKEWALSKEKNWIKNNYHKQTDQYDPETWTFEGIVEDAQLFFRIGYELSNESTFPKWKEGSEFKEIREKQMMDKE